jgi:hypothetical protein
MPGQYVSVLEPAAADDRVTVGNDGSSRGGDLRDGACYCVDVTVNWRNLNTGAAGTTALRIVERDYTRPIAPEDWCRYAPATAVIGSGTVAAIADVATVVPYGLWGYKMLVNPGLGNFEVP